MKYSVISLIKVCCLLISALTLFTAEAKFITTFIPRSQGANTARELVGWQRELYLPYKENYAALASTFEYTRSRDTCGIAKHLFSTNCLTFSGSQYKPLPGSELPERKPTDILADYFGLPTNFHGTLKIEPRIENVIIDLNGYFGLNDWCPGLYLRIHMPIVHTRWTLGLNSCEPCCDKYRGCTKFPDCYMFSGLYPVPMGIECPVVPHADNCPTPPLPQRFECRPTDSNLRTPCPVCCPVNATLNPENPQLNPQLQFRNQNCTTQSIREALSGNFTFGDMVEPWKYGRFDFCPRDKTGLADIDFILGMNFFDCGFAHFGLFGMVVVPTGNRPKAKYIFEPLVGNGRFWEAGGGLTAHLSLNDMCSPYNMGIWIEGNVTHFFDTHQVRSFDFKNNGLLSRYMLLKEFDTAGNYNQVMINAINFATRQCEVSIRFKADVSAKIFATCNNWEFDAGYNFYFKDRECVRIKTDCPCAIDSRIFGIKGLEGVCCAQYVIADQNRILGGSSREINNNNTQTNATMFNPVLPDTVSPQTFECTGGNCVCLAWESKFIPNGEAVSVPTLTAANGYFGITPEMPHFITCADLDPNSAAQCRMLTHKVFAHVGYLFARSCYSPFVGIGAEVEFDGSHDNALSQWGAWLKCGLMF